MHKAILWVLYFLKCILLNYKESGICSVTEGLHRWRSASVSDIITQQSGNASPRLPVGTQVSQMMSLF